MKESENKNIKTITFKRKTRKNQENCRMGRGKNTNTLHCWSACVSVQAHTQVYIYCPCFFGSFTSENNSSIS